MLLEQQAHSHHIHQDTKLELVAVLVLALPCIYMLKEKK
jgi:hypothetical protein